MTFTNKHAIGVEWSSSSSANVSAGANAGSDPFETPNGAVAGAITVAATNLGTPVSGDRLAVYLLTSSEGEDFDTPKHAQRIGVLDTFAENPAQMTVPMHTICFAKGKVWVVSQSAGRTIRVQAGVTFAGSF